MATAGKHIVVTGGCGFFGAWISAKLLAVDARVTIVDAVIAKQKLSMTLDAAAIERISFVEAKIDDPAFIGTLVRIIWQSL